MGRPDVNPVDEYIAAQDEKFQGTLKDMHAIIRSEAPEAEELISYRVPTFKYLYMLVGFGVTKNACSLYTMSPGLVQNMATELEGQNYSGTTLHFRPGEPLPEELIREIVRGRIRENRERARSKKQ